MKLGIVGLPNVGKSTLFNAITNAGAESANYPFCTIDPNIGMVTVPDERLDWLADLYDPKKKTPAVIEFVDIAGLVKGASKGEGLGNKFLSNIRATDAIVHVVRCFDDENVIHVEGGADPARDIEIIDLELVMADMEMVERRIDKAKKAGKGGDKHFLHEAAVFEGLLAHLNEGKSARTYECEPEDMELIRTSDLLSIKPIIYAANLDEDTFSAGFENYPYYKTVRASWRRKSARCSSPSSASPSPASTASSNAPMSCWDSFRSSPAAATSAAHGRSPEAPGRRRPPARSTRTLSAASSAPRSSPLTI